MVVLEIAFSRFILLQIYVDLECRHVNLRRFFLWNSFRTFVGVLLILTLGIWPLPLLLAQHADTKVNCGYSSMGGTRVKKSSKCLLRFHLSINLSDVVGPVECWAEARLISATSIFLLGRLVSGFGLEALHAVTSSSTSEVAAEASLQYLSVCSRSVVFSSCCAGDKGSAAVTQDRNSCHCSKNNSNKAADAWATVEVSVRPNAHIGTNPALRPAWQLLLSRLVAYSRDKAFAMPRPSMLSAAPDACFSESSSRSKGSKGLELRALEDVYSSLKPRDSWQTLWDKGQGMDGRRPSLRAEPGARGLNALPVAVVMRGTDSRMSAYLQNTSLCLHAKPSRPAQSVRCHVTIEGVVLQLLKEDISPDISCI